MTLEEGGRRRVATLSLKLGLLLGLLLLPPLAGDASLATPSRGGGARGQIVFLSDRTPGLGSFGVYVMNGDGSGEHALTRPEPQATEPVWLPGGRQIAFESVASPGDWEVYGGVWSMRTNGSHRKWLLPRVTRLPPDLAWSPDGKRMAFVRGSGLYLARVNGSKARPVFWDTRVLAQPAWSPDGRRLAVADTSGILVLAIGPTRARLLFRTHPLADTYAPSWSPNGRRIAFIGVPRRGGAVLDLIDVDGTHQRLLMRGVGYSSFGSGPSWSSDSTRIVIGRVTGLGSASDVAVVDVRTARSRTIYRGGYSPQWSPTGRSIAFTAQRPDPTGGVYLIRPNGSHRRLLAPIFGYPHFSPDGRRLATVAGGFKGVVFVVNADGTHLRQLTHPFDDSGAVGSPDHQKIAFVRTVSDPLSHEPGPSTVYVVNRDGTGLRRIAFGDAVAWAPDSAQVTFAQDGDIYSAAVAGGAVRQLTSGPEDDSAPAWSSNGATIAFTRALAGSARDICLVDSSRAGPPVCLSAGASAPAWSPDGSMIAFAVGDRSTAETARIGVIRPDGSERRLIGQGYAPAWAPDSRRLAFVDLSRTQDGSLALVNVDGTGMTTLNMPPSLPEAPSWSPDASRLASASCPPQIYDCEIWSVPADNSPSRTLTANRVDDIAPVWWP